MRPNEGPRPATRTARERLDRVRDALRTAPTPVKVVLVAAVLVLVIMVPFLQVRLADLIVVVPLVSGAYAVLLGAAFPPRSVRVRVVAPPGSNDVAAHTPRSRTQPG